MFWVPRGFPNLLPEQLGTQDWFSANGFCLFGGRVVPWSRGVDLESSAVTVGWLSAIGASSELHNWSRQAGGIVQPVLNEQLKETISASKRQRCRAPTQVINSGTNLS
eukprot:1746907-Amphidinium_carterae.1